MISRQRVRALELRARRRIFGNGIGLSTMMRTGMGSEFDQLRDYQLGDPIRSIDWKSSARAHKLIVRSYCDDRNRAMILALDVSRSTGYGSRTVLKETVMREIALMITSSVMQTSDDLAVFLFDDQIEHYIPLQAARRIGARVMHQLSTLNVSKQSGGPTDGTTQAGGQAGLSNVSPLFSAVLARCRKPALMILITDGLSPDYADLLSSVVRRHELMVVRVYDPLEQAFPERAVLQTVDSESGALCGASPTGSAALASFVGGWYRDQNDLFRRHGVAWCDIPVDRPYDEALINFFMRGRTISAESAAHAL